MVSNSAKNSMYLSKETPENADADDKLCAGFVSGLQQFHGKNKLRRESLNFLVKMVNPKEFSALRKEFNKIDTDGSGTLELSELIQAVKRCQSTLLENIFIDKSGVLRLDLAELNMLAKISYKNIIEALKNLKPD